jgi:hypothetical protein
MEKQADKPLMYGLVELVMEAKQEEVLPLALALSETQHHSPDC